MRSLLTILVCGLFTFACSLAATCPASESPALRVATFECDVTPPLGHRLTVEPLASVEQPLAAKGIVLDDGPARYVLCAIDWCILSNDCHLKFRRKAAVAAGTKVENVCVQTVHQHTAPIVDADAAVLLMKDKNPPKLLSTTPEFIERVSDRLAEAVKQSLARLEPFDMIGTGQAKVDRVASSRRVPRANGKVFTRWSWTKNAKLRAAPEGDIDPYLKTITLAKGDKPLVRLHYYAVHPQSRYGDGRASIDFVGLAREAVQKKEGVFQVYFTGCCGDVTVGKYNDRTFASRDRFTRRVQKAMEAAIASTRMVPAEGLHWRCVPLSMPPRTDKGHTEADLRAEMADTKVKPHIRGRAARWIMFMQRHDRPIDVATLRIGNVYILHLPGEPFVDFQLYAQKLRPNDFVAVAGYGDGGPCYICTEAAFAEGGYEPSASSVKPESEAIFREAIRQTLKD